MPEHIPPSEDQAFVRRSLAAAIQIGAIFLVASWCLQIILPFAGIVAWAAIIAVTLYPAHCKLSGALGGRAKTSAIIIVLLSLSILAVPAWYLTGSSIETAHQLAVGLEDGSVRVPAPSEQVAKWPVVGKDIYAVWNAAATNLEDTLLKYSGQVKNFSAWLLKAVAGTTLGVLGFIASIIVSGAFLLSAKPAYSAFRSIGHRLGGENAADFVDLAIATVRSVAKGVLGVALIQTMLATIGLIVMDVPGAGIWAGIVLILAIMQLPPLLVLGPVAFWVFSVTDAVPATLFLIYCMFVSFSDAILKPLLLGRGVDVPMLVILLGAIGGMITSGIIGLFVGSIILSLSYKLFMFWLSPDKAEEGRDEIEPA